MSTIRRRYAAAVGLGATAATWAYLRRLELPRWQRTNHAGEPVTLLEGPAYVLGSVAGVVAGFAVGGAPMAPAALAGLACGTLGAIDDLGPDTADKGLRGHLLALRDGRVTTGAVKIGGLALSGLAAAALVDGPSPAGRSVVGTPLGGAVVAGAANLLNLLDLRPGRALKAGLLLSAPLLAPRGPAAATAAAASSACLVLLPDDLAARSMLGDTGANALGAMLGTAALQRCGTTGRALLLGALVALTLASERVSFTTVIEATPGLRELDALGRRRPR